MEEENEWQKRIRTFASGTRGATLSLEDIIQRILSGMDPELDNRLLVLPIEWTDKLQELCNLSSKAGDKTRQNDFDLLRKLFSVLRRPPDGPDKDSIELILTGCRGKCSPQVESFVYGSLGTFLFSRGERGDATKLMQYALEAAEKHALRWAQIQWRANLALFKSDRSPNEAEHDFKQILISARDAGDKRRAGMILNNLAFINERHLLNVPAAVTYQSEAVAIARDTGDKAAELHRVMHLASLQEACGERRGAFQSWDRGLGLESEIGLSQLGFHAFKHFAQLLCTDYEPTVREILRTHMKRSVSTLSVGMLHNLLKEARKGMIMASWDPSVGSVSFTPDQSFAHSLAVRSLWSALLVYAFQWTEQGFVASDSRGFHWLSIALRQMGYSGAADWALTAAIDLPRLFSNSQISED